MHIDLSGKRTLITGASSGLGASMVEHFARAGARVAINHRDDDAEASALAARLGSENLAVAADVSDADAVSVMFAEIDAAWGGLDILVNNAGIDGPCALTWESDPNAWMRVINVNLKGAYLCARAALQRMTRDKSGVILNITSVHETIAWSGYSAYAASKAGLSMLTKTLAQEAAPYGLRALSIAPGAIRTPINEDVWSDRESYRDLLGKIPLRRLGAPADIAHAAVFLASDLAGYITGTTIVIDGGMTDYPEFAHGG